MNIWIIFFRCRANRRRIISL